jgi:hypothetical protein
MMAGYLQHYEAVIMKTARQIWKERLRDLIETGKIIWVNFIHDEWQTQINGNRDLAVRVGEVQVRSIVDAGISLGLRVPLNGDTRIGVNWKETH